MIISRKIENLDIIIKEELCFSLGDKEKYIKEFKELQEKGVIDKNSQFEDENWTITLSKISKVLHFKINEFLFKKMTKGRDIELSFEEFNIAYRRYILEMIYSDVARGIITGFLSYSKSFLEKTSFLDINKIGNIRAEELDSYRFSMYDKLLTVLKFMNYEVPIEYQEVYNETKLKGHKTRKLPRFISIFKFIDIMEKFKQNATEKELIRYYPVILWNSISFVIPLRPSELLVTRYDCVFRNDGKFFIKIRRTNKKGAPNKYRALSFDIESHYREEEVEINENIYNEILHYRSLIEKYCPNDKKEFLFSLELYKFCKKNKGKIGINEELLTTNELGNLIDSFYVDIMQNKFNINITERHSEESDELSVERLVAYDSRHISIINLILMGNEHYTVMKLAGHGLISTTKGYYDHIEEYANAYSINYAKYLSGKASDKMNELDDISTSKGPNRSLSNWRRINNDKRKLTKVDGGYCSYHLEDFNPCYTVNGNHSICNYFTEEKIETIDKEIDDISNKLHSEIRALKELVNNAENITRFSEKYSVLTESIRYQMNKKALLAYKKENFKEMEYTL